MPIPTHLVQEFLLASQAHSQFKAAFGYYPNTLDAAIAKLQSLNQMELADLLREAVLECSATLLDLFGLSNAVLTWNGEPALHTLDPVDYLDPAALEARVRNIMTKVPDEYPIRHLLRAVADEDVSDEPNAGARNVFGTVSYYGGATRRLLWYSPVTKTVYKYLKGKLTAQKVTQDSIVWTADSGPFLGHIAASALNLRLLAACDNVADKPVLLERVNTLADTVESTLNRLREFIPACAAVGGNAVMTLDAVPAAIKAKYPKGYGKVTLLGDNSIHNI